MRYFIVYMSVLLFVFTACKEQAPVNGLQLSNPASENCYDKGGKLKILNSPDGQYGICIFTDWSVCEEWAFFRKECSPGDCAMRCIKKKGVTGWYDCKGNFLFEDTCIPEPPSE